MGYIRRCGDCRAGHCEDCTGVLKIGELTLNCNCEEGVHCSRPDGPEAPVPTCTPCMGDNHEDCNGMLDQKLDEVPELCLCTSSRHISRLDGASSRQPFAPIPSVDPDSEPIYPVPENDPGILAEAFPEITDDRYFNVRMKPDRVLIQDLLDVEVENDNGEWVPLVPSPFASYLYLHRCLCGKFRLGIVRYQEHYAYAHILGMDDL